MLCPIRSCGGGGGYVVRLRSLTGSGTLVWWWWGWNVEYIVGFSELYFMSGMWCGWLISCKFSVEFKSFGYEISCGIANGLFVFSLSEPELPELRPPDLISRILLKAMLFRFINLWPDCLKKA